MVRRLAEDVADGLCARAPGRLDEILALGDGALDLGDGVRATVTRRRPPHGAHAADPPAPMPHRTADIGEILVQADDLKRRVRELGEEITRDYDDKDLLLSASSRARCSSCRTSCAQIDVPCEVDFMAVASYGDGDRLPGVVRILKDLDAPIEGRHVLIVEDIVDSG